MSRAAFEVRHVCIMPLVSLPHVIGDDLHAAVYGGRGGLPNISTVLDLSPSQEHGPNDSEFREGNEHGQTEYKHQQNQCSLLTGHRPPRAYINGNIIQLHIHWFELL